MAKTENHSKNIESGAPKVSHEISVVTIKKAEQKSYSRVLSGRSVAEDREASL